MGGYTNSLSAVGSQQSVWPQQSQTGYPVNALAAYQAAFATPQTGGQWGPQTQAAYGQFQQYPSQQYSPTQQPGQTGFDQYMSSMSPQQGGFSPQQTGGMDGLSQMQQAPGGMEVPGQFDQNMFEQPGGGGITDYSQALGQSQNQGLGSKKLGFFKKPIGWISGLAVLAGTGIAIFLIARGRNKPTTEAAIKELKNASDTKLKDLTAQGRKELTDILDELSDRLKKMGDKKPDGDGASGGGS